jgi:hypothetical protein
MIGAEASAATAAGRGKHLSSKKRLDIWRGRCYKSVRQTIKVMNVSPSAGVVAATLLAVNACGMGSLWSTTSFQDISGAEFLDLPGSSLLEPLVSGPVTVTPDNLYMSGAFFNFTPSGNPADPSSGDGFAASLKGNWKAGPLTLNFSAPVAAFGLTFAHFAPDHVFGTWGAAQPATLFAYEGPNGSGRLLGSVASSGWEGPWSASFDFVGLWSDSLNIRSVILSGTSEGKTFAVDGYGLSLTPIPEPGTIVFIGLGLAWLVFGRPPGRRGRLLAGRRP